MTSYTNRLGTAPEEGIKAPVVAATTANITLSGEQTIDGVAVVAGNRVLVKDQTDNTENGIYDCVAGAWTRTTDFNAAEDVIDGVLVHDANNNYVYQASFSGTWTPGTTALTFTRNVFSDLQSNNFFYPNDGTSAKNAYVVTEAASKTALSAYLNHQMITFRPSHTSDSTAVTLDLIGDGGTGLGAKTYYMEDGSTAPASGFFTTDRDYTCRLSSDGTKWIHVIAKIDETTNAFSTLTGSARDNTDLDSELDALDQKEHLFYPNQAASAADDYIISHMADTKTNTFKTNRLYLWSPSHTNATTSPTLALHDGSTKGTTKPILMEDGLVPAASELDTSKYYLVRYDGTSCVVLLQTLTNITQSQLANNSVGLAQLEHLTAGHMITMDNTGVPQSEVNRKWVKLGDSGQLTSGSEHTFTGIPANATMIEIACNSLSAGASVNLYMQVGYGPTPTYLSAAGDYIGRTTQTNNVGSGSGTSWSTYAFMGNVYSANSQSHKAIKLLKINDGSDTWMINGSGVYTTTVSGHSVAGGRIKAASLVSDLSAIRLYLSSSTFDDGYMTCYYYGNPDA